MRLNKTLLALAISTLMLSACSDTDEKDTSLTDGSLNETSGINDASTSGLNKGSGMNGSELNGSGMNGMSGNGDYASTLGPEFNDPNNPLSKRTVYFMLDSSEVMPDFIPVIAAHAQYLIANPGQKITLEGNGDERGSREYNIALGEQRAKSVSSMMKIKGVSDNQLNIVSYGEEKPVAFGSDESAWEQNRRVEIVYQPK
ncbi:peptidoglycan-associated lipoprotein Pal [Methylobacter sp. S3L5C]|uniref:peptidoglycan-associated lipoprotein Pal n=1 Tax=Methylobacter sp. S3L5C TaxID=2839024 RepID=UPI001FACE11B|nr:peptidoglycan-associated lipoprotein Pal [Methylobacter sp. S3L5C]UOA10302.1 peptidoglycan-associated lipoprotein Pal [Methylobacter sp. S3L5C]